jgi:hypothetical protein
MTVDDKEQCSGRHWQTTKMEADKRRRHKVALRDDKDGKQTPDDGKRLYYISAQKG